MANFNAKRWTSCFIFLFIYCFPFKAISQSIVPIEGIQQTAIYDSVWKVTEVPNDLLSGKYKSCYFCPRQKNAVQYYWSSWSVDGQYCLSFTPHQMVLFTVHENPNPNRIYWVAPISVQQYEHLKKKCKFKYKALEDHDENDIFDRSYENFNRLLSMINKKMGNLKFDIPTKEVFEATRSVDFELIMQHRAK